MCTSSASWWGAVIFRPNGLLATPQSRWSYMNEDEVREVVANYRANHMPLDAVVLDIDYMEHYKDFTVDAQRFPRFADFAAEMKAQGIHLVPIIDAAVKVEDGYDVYEEGVKNGYFCTNQDGTPFVAGVWPGRVHFPDMLNPEARAWFGSQYKVLLDQGIEGFWNDMNEPAIFYAEERLKKTFAQIEKYSKQNLDISSFGAFTGMVAGLSNNENDYKLFYHNTKQGRMRHDKVHNLFGYNMTRAAGEAFERLEPDKRILMYSRSACIGMHRYGGIWTGDNHSWWSHILLALHMMPSLNMCGFLYEAPTLAALAAIPRRIWCCAGTAWASSLRCCGTTLPTALAGRSPTALRTRLPLLVFYNCATCCCPTFTAST